MANAEEKKTVGVLRKATILADAPPDLMLRLAAVSKVETYRARQVIYLPGDRAIGIHFLAAGRVKVSKVTRDGKELTLAYRTAGDSFGESCLLEGGPREEMAEAMELSTTAEVERGALEKIIASSAPISYHFARTMIARRRELESKVEQLIFKDVGSKLAELLLRLGSEHGVENKRGLVLGVKITHQEMANLIGSTRETVSLTLSQFKRKGFIETEGRKVILADREGLRSLA
jgi:CRP/FNR family transcriptional regulator, cyclic AMP receptor protein